MKKRTSLFLESGQLDKLKEISKKTGAPVSEIIRRAIGEYVQKQASASGRVYVSRGGRGRQF